MPPENPLWHGLFCEIENRPNTVIEGNRRFTCLAPGLIRMEFAPDGIFEDRRSLVAYPKQAPVAFRSVQKSGDDMILETGRCTLISRQHDKAFFRSNLATALRQYLSSSDESSP